MAERGKRLNGARVLAARLSRGWTQTQLARAAGVTPSTISRIEAGERRRVELETGQRLADALAVALPELYADDGEGPEPAPATSPTGEAGRETQHSGRPIADRVLGEWRHIGVWGSVPSPSARRLAPNGTEVRVPTDALRGATGRLASYRLDDTSCAPQAQPGEYAVVDRDGPLRDGHFHIICYREQWVARRLQLAAAPGWASVVEDDAVSRPLPVAELRVQGVVIGFVSGFREAI